MKNTTKTFPKIIMGTLLTGVVAISGVGLTHAETPTVELTQQVEQETKYSSSVMEAVRLSLGVDMYSTELDAQISSMPKVEVMDRYLASFGQKVKGKEVREVVLAVFNADLNMISEKNYGSKLSIYNVSVMESVRQSLNIAPDSTELDAQIMAMPKNEVMDRYIEMHDYALTGAENRILINQIFGVNLDGISGLEHAGISIYSKGQWILQDDSNLFIVSSSLDDVEIYVASTDYFKEQTGLTQLPESLSDTLISRGFTYDAEMDAYVYRNPTGESVPDAFKGQTLGSVVGTIQTYYPNL